MLCGLSECPLLRKLRFNGPSHDKVKQDLFGPSPSIFVGWKGYPHVNVGPMTSLDTENPALLDDPGSWYGLDFDDIILMRSQLVRSKQPVSVHSRERFILENQEIALSVKPIDVESHFKKKPSVSMSFSPISQPMGPAGDLDKMRVVDNPVIPRRVDSVVSDELKANDAAHLLYQKGHDVYYLTRVLSSGALGREERRKMVPTRWSITAVDDLLCKELLKEVKNYPSISDYRVYSNTYLDNHFEILFMPGSWEFEQFEAWAPKTLWTLGRTEYSIAHDWEPYGGRKEYAFNEGGGYYAGRIGVAEKLHGMRKQARVIVFREIHEGYVMPVGVWEVRENVRKAMESKPVKFSNLKEALEHINSRLRIPLRRYMERSELLKQRRLTEYL